jgi:hypothetical protein
VLAEIIILLFFSDKKGVCCQVASSNPRHYNIRRFSFSSNLFFPTPKEEFEINSKEFKSLLHNICEWMNIELGKLSNEWTVALEKRNH